MKKKSTIYIKFLTDSIKRLDVLLSEEQIIPRNQAIKIIEAGLVYLNNEIETKKSRKIQTGDVVEIFEPELSHQQDIIDIPIVYENESFLVINKPPTICCHKRSAGDLKYSVMDFAKKRWQGNHDEAELHRYGIVHRIDKETSGILIIAKNTIILAQLQDLFQTRMIRKKYIAFIEKGLTPKKGIITYNIMRDPLVPIQMTWSKHQGKTAETLYEIIEQRKDFDIVECTPKTGRTHQIRVHMQSLGHPLIGDALYGKHSPLIDRHALHAAHISFTLDNKEYQFDIPLPEDMKNISSL
jgi:23S rRNA pseudouridine1911/1915/1917 synthase